MALESKLARIATRSSIGFSLGLLVVAAILWSRGRVAGSPPRTEPSVVGTFHRGTLAGAVAPAELPPPRDPVWSEIAREANVEVITDQVLFVRDGVRRVDLTERLLERLVGDDGEPR